MTSRPRARPCSTMYRKCSLSSGAPPVMSNVLTVGLFFMICCVMVEVGNNSLLPCVGCKPKSDVFGTKRKRRAPLLRTKQKRRRSVHSCNNKRNGTQASVFSFYAFFYKTSAAVRPTCEKKYFHGGLLSCILLDLHPTGTVNLTSNNTSTTPTKNKSLPGCIALPPPCSPSPFAGGKTLRGNGCRPVAFVGWVNV